MCGMLILGFLGFIMFLSVFAMVFAKFVANLGYTCSKCSTIVDHNDFDQPEFSYYIRKVDHSLE